MESVITSVIATNPPVSLVALFGSFLGFMACSASTLGGDSRGVGYAFLTLINVIFIRYNIAESIIDNVAGFFMNEGRYRTLTSIISCIDHYGNSFLHLLKTSRGSLHNLVVARTFENFQGFLNLNNIITCANSLIPH